MCFKNLSNAKKGMIIGLIYWLVGLICLFSNGLFSQLGEFGALFSYISSIFVGIFIIFGLIISGIAMNSGLSLQSGHLFTYTLIPLTFLLPLVVLILVGYLIGKNLDNLKKKKEDNVYGLPEKTKKVSSLPRILTYIYWAFIFVLICFFVVSEVNYFNHKNDPMPLPSPMPGQGSTTTINNKLCGDGICDAFEKAHPDACPADCK